MPNETKRHAPNVQSLEIMHCVRNFGELLSLSLSCRFAPRRAGSHGQAGERARARAESVYVEMRRVWHVAAAARDYLNSFCLCVYLV